MDKISAVCTGLCMNSSFCSFVDLFVDPGLEDLRCSDVDSLGIESTDNSNSSVSGLGGGGGGQLLVPRWTCAGVVALLYAFLIPGCVPRQLSCLGGLVG